MLCGLSCCMPDDPRLQGTRKTYLLQKSLLHTQWVAIAQPPTYQSVDRNFSFLKGGEGGFVILLSYNIDQYLQYACYKISIMGRVTYIQSCNLDSDALIPKDFTHYNAIAIGGQGLQSMRAHIGDYS